MKRIIFIFSAFALLTGCVKNDPVEGAGAGELSQEAIAFDAPVLMPSVKAGVAEVPATYVDTLTFGVFASNANTSSWKEFSGEYKVAFEFPAFYMNNVEISRQKVGEDYVWKNAAKKYYWPKSSYLYFFAYSPYKSNLASVTETGLAFTDYVVSTKVDEQEDLLYTGLCTQNKPYVTVEFQHALSAINFVVSKSADTDAPIAVKSIGLYGVKDKGDFSVGLGYDESSLITYTPAWSDQVYSNGLTCNYTAFYPATPHELDTTPRYVHNIDGTDAGNKATLMLMPQPVGDMRVEIYYLLDGISQYESFPIPDEWKPGMRYTYTLTFTAEEILFEPEAEAWDDSDDTDEDKIF